MKWILIISLVLTINNIVAQNFVDINANIIGGVHTAWGDYDSDGDFDLLIAGITIEGDRFCKVFRNDGNNVFVDQASIELTGLYGTAAWGDYDNDNDLDILLSGLSGQGGIAVIYRNDDGIFIEQSDIIINASGYSKFADYNNDGLQDILILEGSSDIYKTRLYKNHGNNIFYNQENSELPGVSGIFVSGDIDLDGDLDILLTGHTNTSESDEYYNYTTKIHINNGQNIFKKENIISLNSPYAKVIFKEVILGDIENDGDLDIISVGGGGGFSIYINEGNNSFARSYKSGFQERNNDCDLGDYDNDGYLDILLTCEKDSKFITYIYHNNGNYNFEKQSDSIILGNREVTNKWVDYNGDGRLDIVLSGSEVGNESLIQTKIYENKNVQTNSAPPAPENPEYWIEDDKVYLKWSHSRGDETPYIRMNYNVRVGTVPGGNDVVSSMSLPSGKRLLPDMGNAQLDTTYLINNLKKGTYYWSVQAIDDANVGGGFSEESSFTFSSNINASGLFGDSISASSLKLYWTRGNGSSCIVFALKGSAGLPTPQNNISYIADNRFGFGEQLGLSGWYCIYNGTGNSVSVSNLESLAEYRFCVIEYEEGPVYNSEGEQTNYINLQTGAFSELTNIDIPGLFNSSMSIGDFDNDNDQDLLLSGNADVFYNDPGMSELYFNESENGFLSVPEINLPDINNGSVHYTDYNNDGKLDFILAGSGKFFKYQNNGDTTFTGSEILNFPFFDCSVDIGDFDNDGDLDIFSAGLSGSGEVAKILKNNKDGSFNVQPGLEFAGISNGEAVWGDYNNDSFDDILLCGSGKTIVFRNNGDNTFEEQDAIKLKGLYNASAAWGDYDSDGDLDVIIAGDSSRNNGDYSLTRIYRNEGSNVFTDQVTIRLLGVGYGSVSWGDVDIDGDLDILLSGKRFGVRYTTIYINNGENSFIKEENFSLPGVSHGTSRFSDIDGDGDLDIVISGEGNSTGMIGSSGGNPSLTTKIFINEISRINKKPEAPTGLRTTLSYSEVRFSWNPIKSDETTERSMSYNMRIGTTPGGCEIMSPLSLITGYRQVSDIGNCQLDTFHIIKNIGPGTYYWSMQGIDNCYTGGEFAPEESFTIDSVQASSLQAELVPGHNNSLALKWKNGNGTRRLVFCKEGSFEKAIPNNNISYISDQVFGYGDQIGNSGWYCVYNGRGDSTIISGLLPAESYALHVIEYDGEKGSENYFRLDGEGNPGHFSSGLFTEQTHVEFPGINGASVNWGDINKDGYIDVIIAGRNYLNEEITKIFYNSENNFFAEAIEYSIPGIADGSVEWGDFDNDDDLDLLVSGYGYVNYIKGYSKILQNMAPGILTEMVDFEIDRAWGGDAEWSDFNNDGVLDFLIFGSYYDTEPIQVGLKLYIGDGNNNFVENTSPEFPKIYNGSADCGDYDSDGDTDILILGIDSNGNLKTGLYTNSGDGSFHELETANLLNLQLSSCDFGDYDNDGDLDILVSGTESRPYPFSPYSKTVIYRNENNSFEEQSLIELPGIINGDLKWGDYDGDGDLDILLAGEGKTGPISRIFRNNSDNSFTEISDINLTGVKSSSVDWADYDNDGDLDFILSGEVSSGAKVSILYRNNSIMKAGNYLPNRIPEAPTGLENIVDHEGYTLCWNSIENDETKSKAMTYNVQIGTSPGSSDICSAMASEITGFRRVVDMGNAQMDTSFLIKGLPEGIYYWRVQGVDQAYAGGAWSAIDSFEVKTMQAYFSNDTVCLNSPTHFIDMSTSKSEEIQTRIWDFGDGQADTTNNLNPTHTFSKSGTYLVTLTISGVSLNDTISKNVIVKPSPKASFNAEPVCRGAKTSFLNTTIGTELEISSWHWDFGDGTTSSLEQPAEYGYLNAGDYNVKLSVQLDNGCTDSIQKTVIVAAFPNNALSVDGVTNFCEGDSVVITANHDPLFDYQWMLNGNSITGADSSKFKAIESGNYAVRITNTIGSCVSTSEETSVNVAIAPSAPTIINSGPDIFCSGDSVILSLTDNPSYNYQWKLNGNYIGIEGSSLSAKSAGMYTAEITNNEGCSRETSNSISIDLKPALPEPEINAVGPNYWYLAVSNDSAKYYRWYYNSTMIQESDDNLYVAGEQLGNYFAEISADGECYTKSAVISIPDNVILSATEAIDPWENLKIYPNPTTGLFTLEMDNPIRGELDINIFNERGSNVIKIKFLKEMNHFKTQIDLSDQPAAVYLIGLMLNEHRASRKLVVE